MTGVEKVFCVDLQVILFLNYSEMPSLLLFASLDEMHISRECVGKVRELVIIRLCVCLQGAVVWTMYSAPVRDRIHSSSCS